VGALSRAGFEADLKPVQGAGQFALLLGGEQVFTAAVTQLR